MSKMATILTAALVLLGAAGVVVFLAYGRELSRARDKARRGARMAHTAAGPIEYAECGAGAPLLSIHGADGGYDQGLANVANLVGEDFRVIAPPRFGYLGTPKPSDTSSTFQADAHVALLAELKVDKAVCVGISAGSRSAVELVKPPS